MEKNSKKKKKWSYERIKGNEYVYSIAVTTKSMEVLLFDIHASSSSALIKSNKAPLQLKNAEQYLQEEC